MNFLTKTIIKFSCNKVGNDEFCNEYYLGKKNNKRFVVYNGSAEPSKIPAHWHAWMHYTTSEIPTQSMAHKHSWQKIHLPNLTGTINAHLFDKKTRKKVSSDYQSWQPEQ